MASILRSKAHVLPDPSVLHLAVYSAARLRSLGSCAFCSSKEDSIAITALAPLRMAFTDTAALVSQNKKRWQRDGFDLDLSYITDRIIAMGFPAQGLQSLYRNPLVEVSRFLESYHDGRFRVYNLCIEASYDEGSFGGAVKHFLLYDGQAPPLHLVQQFCEDATEWLLENPMNVVVVHCKAGKGRTGAMICALLLYLLVLTLQHIYHQDKAALLEGDCLGGEVQAVVNHFVKQRTMDGKCTLLPSQQRFVTYFFNLISQQTAALSCASPAHILLESVSIMGLPDSLLAHCTVSIWWRPPGSHDTQLLIHAHHHPSSAGCLSPAAATDNIWGSWSRDSSSLTLCMQQTGDLSDRTSKGPTLKKHSNMQNGLPVLHGDIKVQVFKGLYSKDYSGVFKPGKSILFCWVNTAFLPSDGALALAGAQLDKVHKPFRTLEAPPKLTLRYGFA